MRTLLAGYGGAPILKSQSVKHLTENAIGDIPVILAGPGVGFSLGMVLVFMIVCVTIIATIFKTGWRLRT